MPFPLPKDPVFQKEIIWIWINDIDDRLEENDLEGAKESWNLARSLYIALPPGNGSEQLEKTLVEYRVKLDSIT